jgi:hypothetical protein
MSSAVNVSLLVPACKGKSATDHFVCVRVPAHGLSASFAEPFPPRSLTQRTRYSLTLSDAEPPTWMDVAVVVVGAEEIAIAGASESLSRKRDRRISTRRDSSSMPSSGKLVAAVAAVAVESSLAPPHPARIIEETACATRTAVAFNLNFIPGVPSSIRLRRAALQGRQAVIRVR